MPKPSKHPANQPKMRYCCICAEELGVLSFRDYEPEDTCGSWTCDREMCDQLAWAEAERREAAEQDRYSRY